MTNFIKVEKDGETIEVHPDALKNHLELGWVIVVEETAHAGDEPVVETPAKPEKKVARKS
jgi:hypothetical protein